MATVNDFIDLIKQKGIAKQNRFLIQFQLPKKLISALATQSKIVQEVVSLTCMTTDLPGYQISTNEVKYGNLPRKVAYEHNLSQWNTTFINTGDMDEKLMFDTWLKLMFPNGNHKVEYYENYISDITVSLLDTNDNIIYSILLEEAYPVTVTELNLDRAQPSNYMTFNVTWDFFNFKPIIDGQPLVNTIDGVNDSQRQNNIDFATFVNGLDGYKNPAAMTAGTVPAPVIANPVPDVIEALNRINRLKFLISNGVNSKNIGSLLKTIAGDITAATGIPTDQATAVANYANAIAKGFPINVPGLGDIPTSI